MIRLWIRIHNTDQHNKKSLMQITMNDLPVGRSVDETLRLVQAFQYTDKHGEVTTKC